MNVLTAIQNYKIHKIDIFFCIFLSFSFISYFIIMSIRNCLKIVGKSLYNLENQIYTHKNVIFKGCRNIRYYDNAPTFPEARTVVFDDCDTNSVYYWLQHDIYPKLDRVILNSRTDDPDIFNRFMYDMRNVRMDDNGKIKQNVKFYMSRWWQNNDGFNKNWLDYSGCNLDNSINYIVLSRSDIVSIIAELEYENGKHNCNVIDK